MLLILLAVVAPKTAIVMIAIPVPTTFAVAGPVPIPTTRHLVMMDSGVTEPILAREESAPINTLVTKDVRPERHAIAVIANQDQILAMQERPASSRPIPVMPVEAVATLVTQPCTLKKLQLFPIGVPNR
jgi:hypothetical protein